MNTQLDGLPCAPSQVDDFLSEPPDAVVKAVGRMGGNFMVLGAGGKMGLHLCLMLRKAIDRSGRRARLTAVSRFGNASDRTPFESRGVAVQSCDLCKPGDLESLESAENIIFLAGAKFGTAGQPGLLRRMNVEMPEMVANHFSNSRITAFSTGCVYSFVPVNSSGSSEDSETNPVGEYALSCLGREQAFRRSALEFGSRLALIRLNYSVEFRYGVLVDIAQRVLRGDPIDVTMGHVNLIWQRDAVAQTLLSHELASTAPFIINITGPSVHRVRDLATRFGEIFGRAPIICGQEADTAWLNDATRSHRLFGAPETTLDQMIDWVAAWQMQGLQTLGKPTGYEKRDGNF
ncbi:NAD(P)-dependent oxidoreductase [Spartobacteria bacterium LR76]|nr:NAD(P)-dependent oxidoreductase [Spartobacteria bacterium LR76]